jgi:hypothetical protein
VINFALNLTSTSPVPTSGAWYAGYKRLSDTALPVSCCEGYNNYFHLNFTPPPPGADYHELTFHSFTRPIIDVETETLVIDATAVITPEPATIALLGSGLAALGGVAARRGRRLRWRGRTRADG